MQENVSENHSNTWSRQFTTVTSFSKILAAVLFVTLPFVGFYLGINYQKLVDSSNQTIDNSFISNYQKTSPITPVISTVAINDIPSLFPGIPWEATKAGIIEVPDISTHNITKVSSTLVDSSMVQVVPKGFGKYYNDQLLAKGWKSDIRFAAQGGPDSTGQVGYQKDDHYFLIRSNGIVDPNNSTPFPKYKGYILSVEYN